MTEPTGWFAADCNAWEYTREKLLRLGPLDEADARTDLRFLESQTRLWIKTSGRNGRRWPGRVELAKRWGRWPDWQVRKLLVADDWHDPERPVAASELQTTVSRAAKVSPGRHQVTNHSPPGQERLNADTSPETTRSPPGGHQVASIARDQEHRSTEHREKNSAPVGAAAPADAGPLFAPRPANVSPEPPAAPPTPAPVKAPRAKGSPKPKPPPTGYHEAIAAFGDAYESLTGQRYPWQFTGKDADGARVKAWLGAANVTVGAPEEGLARLRAAIRVYLAAEKAGKVFPFGRLPSTVRFTKELPEWLGRNGVVPLARGEYRTETPQPSGGDFTFTEEDLAYAARVAGS